MTSPVTDPLDGVDLGSLLDHGPEAEVPAPADPEPMVKTSIKIPVELLEWLKAEAACAGVGVSTLLRRFAEEKRARAVQDDVLVPFGEIERALSDLIRRSHPPAA